jgi:hypothetical protein
MARFEGTQAIALAIEDRVVKQPEAEFLSSSPALLHEIILWTERMRKMAERERGT